MEGVRSTERGALAKLRAVGGLCLEVSLRTWGPNPVLYERFFAIQYGRSLPIRKKMFKNGSGSHVPSETSGKRTSMALELGSEDSQLSGAYALQVGGDPCPVRRGLVAAVKCNVRKACFFLVYRRR